MIKIEENRGIQDIQTIQRTYIRSIIKPGDTVVDATAGLGRDTVFLAECVGIRGTVYAFDIQEEALTATRDILITHGLLSRARLIQDSHTELGKYISKGVRAVVFNLGYLPGSSQKVITRPETTLQAVRESFKLLVTKGIVCLTVYLRHDGGKTEAEELIRFSSLLSRKDFSVLQGTYLNQGEFAPSWIIIQKNREEADENSPSDNDSKTGN